MEKKKKLIIGCFAAGIIIVATVVLLAVYMFHDFSKYAGNWELQEYYSYDKEKKGYVLEEEYATSYRLNKETKEMEKVSVEPYTYEIKSNGQFVYTGLGKDKREGQLLKDMRGVYEKDDNTEDLWRCNFTRSGEKMEVVIETKYGILSKQVYVKKRKKKLL